MSKAERFPVLHDPVIEGEIKSLTAAIAGVVTFLATAGILVANIAEGINSKSVPQVIDVFPGIVAGLIFIREARKQRRLSVSADL